MEPSELASVPEPMDWDSIPEFPLDSSPRELDPEQLLFGDPPLAAGPPQQLSALLGKARISVRKKGNKKWKRPCEDLDMLWLESRKEAVLLDVPQHAFGELKVYATHKSSRSLLAHEDASTMLQERHRREGSADGMIPLSLKNDRDNNQFKVSTSKSNGRDPVLCVIVSVKDGTVAAMSPVLAIFRHQKEFPAALDSRVREAFRVLLEEAQRSPANVMASEVTADSLRQCWRGICEGHDDVDVREHLCYNDLQLVMRRRQNVWNGHENGEKWAERGLWDSCMDRETQLAKVEEAVTPSAEERRNDDPLTVYCLPYLDMKHSTMMWFCWADLEAAKRYFLPLRSLPPSNPNRNTWIVTTHDLLENEGRPLMLFKLPQEKTKESAPTK